MIIREIINFFIDPLNLLLLLLVISAVLYRLKRRKAFRICTLFFVTLFLVTATSPLPDYLVERLERNYTVLEIGDHLTMDTAHIIVLGSSHVSDMRFTGLDRLSATSLSRLVEGVRVHNRIRSSILITSGYGKYDKISNATAVKNAALELGLDGSRIQMLEKAANTWEEAQYYRERFGTSVPLILVTSATHMKRAMMVFKAMGLDPIPAPTDFIVKKRIRRDWLSHENFRKVQIALHEYIGLVYYRWKLG